MDGNNADNKKVSQRDKLKFCFDFSQARVVFPMTLFSYLSEFSCFSDGERETGFRNEHLLKLVWSEPPVEPHQLDYTRMIACGRFYTVETFSRILRVFITLRLTWMHSTSKCKIVHDAKLKRRGDIMRSVSLNFLKCQTVANEKHSLHMATIFPFCTVRGNNINY